ncbi:MAG: nucleoside-diphosphate sugar epimerase/dehydratase [Syntrophorhabdaceae bacterium]|nr:nucleoside-diphosphate sugar epimerase/dehydratase [Syntrophorhabdaceae bacterium]MDD5243729.1 nucleoside-diphosphate sugar epimerase/dehydratase [Syntrophorhabdaceae bacterium]
MDSKGLIQSIVKTSLLKRTLFFVLSDIILIVISLFIAFTVHFDLNLNIDYPDIMDEVLLYFIVAKLVAFAIFRVYKITWRYVGITDLVNIIFAIIFAELLLIVLSLPNSYLSPFALTGFPKRVFLVDGIVSLFLIAGLRISKRLYLEVIREKKFVKKGKRAIILGAGNTGEMILRDIARQGYGEFSPIGFLDDDKSKVGTYIHGIKVIGTTEALEDVIAKDSVEAMIIAIPRLNRKKLKDIYDTAKKADVKTIKIVPRIFDFDKPDINLKALEDISVEDLIGRQIVQIDYRGIKDFIRDRTVLITGAGGSIGSELVMQVCAFQPGRIVLFDIDDTELHNMSIRMKKNHPELADNMHLVIGDIRDRDRVNEVFGMFHPQIIFHAAAYKHVPMMEYNPKEAVKVNIFGTHVIARAAKEYGVEKFIMISTDKAVMPTSVMGATKRVAEYVCQALNGSEELRAESEELRAESEGQRLCDNAIMRGCDNATKEPRLLNPSSYHLPITPSTRFISVRFGNVLGSRGSVLPLFMEQLKYGGPLTVTHKDMVRYFMTIPEAVSLILQASMMGEGGEVFVLDMGEPVRIVELAEELIGLHGLKPYKEIDIEFIGVRPGEKLFEEILTAEEGTIASKHEKVFIAKNSERYSMDDIENILKEFQGLLSDPSTENDVKVRELLKKYVKHYEEQS